MKTRIWTLSIGVAIISYCFFWSLPATSLSIRVEIPQIKVVPAPLLAARDWQPRSDEALRNQYLITNVNGGVEEPVAPPTDFASLAPGSYRLLMRATTADGVQNQEVAVFSFTVASPFWQRWWFCALISALVGGLAYATYHHRAVQSLALDRLRAHIAGDLHDEVGTSLSQITILSEVARQQISRCQALNGAELARVWEPVAKVAAASREAVDAMSDIIWAVNPRRDYLRDLTQRLCQFANDMLAARDIAVHFHAPPRNLSLGTDVRRQVFLIFKESINNIARHAACTEVEIEVRVAERHLTLDVRDNGCGFATALTAEGNSPGGNGLPSMRRRAAQLGGTLAVSSHPGHGTVLELIVPLRPHRTV